MNEWMNEWMNEYIKKMNEMNRSEYNYTPCLQEAWAYSFFYLLYNLSKLSQLVSWCSRPPSSPLRADTLVVLNVKLEVIAYIVN